MADNSILLTFQELTESVGGSILYNGSSAAGIFGVATDSRSVQAGFLFVPLMGEFQDGHDYINSAVTSGAVCAFVDEAHGKTNEALYRELARDQRICVIQVVNTLTALQDAARFYVTKFPKLKKIGITGSSGKTTTKEIVGAIFATRFSVVMNEGNFNSETGLPLSVFKIRNNHEIGIFELGMNRKGEIREIAKVLSPDLALITNIGTAHIGILGTQAAIAEEKKSIFSFFSETCVGFVPEKDEWTPYLKDIRKGSVKTYGLLSTEGIEHSESRGIDGSLILYKGERIAFPLPGGYNLANAIGAIAVAAHVGLSPSEIKQGIETVQPLFGRAQIIRGKRTVILDCYNANPDSMEKAIDFCSSLPWKGKKILVAGSMLELGDNSAAEHLRVCAQLASSDADRVFLYGEEMVSAGKFTDWKGIPNRLFTDIEGLKAALSAEVEDGDLVFLKGSRGMALERALSSILPERGQEPVHA